MKKCMMWAFVVAIVGQMWGLGVWPTLGQLQTEPHPMDTFLKSVLDFKEPTGIRGTIRFWEHDHQTLWLNWESRSDDRPWFNAGWGLIPGEATLAVHPEGAEQIQVFQQMAKGTKVELIIQLDGDGKRRILSFQDLTNPRKFPL